MPSVLGLPVDVLAFGLVAIFLVYRLRAILGRRHDGDYRRAGPLAASSNAPSRNDERYVYPAQIILPSNVGIIHKLTTFEAVDRKFSVPKFIDAAIVVFQLTAKSYAEGDVADVKKLMSDHVVKSLNAEIMKRGDYNKKEKLKIIAINSVEIVDAIELEGIAFITVEFKTQQEKQEGSAAESPTEQYADIIAVVDRWTFKRQLQSLDPSWLLDEIENI